MLGYDPLEHTFNYVKHLPPNRFLYEFGVYTGKAMRGLTRAFMDGGVPLKSAVGFDSLEGLPEESPHVWNNPEWPPGVFNAQEWHGVRTPAEVLRKYDEMWEGLTPKPYVIPGWFKDTLNAQTVEKYQLGPASYVHVDVDIYASAVECLDFIFQHKLVAPGTLIRYDDWNSTPEWTAGESRAHLEMTTQHNIICRRISMNVFVVC